MPRQSETANVRKNCACVKWKVCKHPWYISYREGTEIGPNGKVREKGLRCKLAPLVGREPVDFEDAKTEAQRAILAWKDGRDARGLLPGDAPTVAMLIDAYNARPTAGAGDKERRGPIVRTRVHGSAFGDWRAAAVTFEALEAFRQQRPLVAGNRDLALLRAAFNHALVLGLVPSTPFRVGPVAVVKLRREEPRARRLHPGEAERLIAAAVQPWLRDLILAALETGCRKGELLSLQWEQVRGDLFLPAGKTKTKKSRRIPISSVLRTVLERRRFDPAGNPLPPSAFVFGDEIGRRRRHIQRSWEVAVLRAHGHTPVWRQSPRRHGRNLMAESRAHLRAIGLHFHDLRREAGSRWMDANVPLATIQRWFGHSNISQTSRYLAANGGGDAEAMRAFEQATGRLPNVAVFADPKGAKPIQSDPTLIENIQQNTIVH